MAVDFCAELIPTTPVETQIDIACARWSKQGKWPVVIGVVGPPSILRDQACDRVAQWILCHQPHNGPCGHCPGCQGWVHQSHVDLGELAWPQSGSKIPRSVGIDPVRQALSTIDTAPVWGRYRVLRLPDLAQFTQAATHALLKAWEEPPSATIFLYPIPAVAILPATLRSRSQWVRLPPLQLAPASQAVFAQKWLDFLEGKVSLEAWLVWIGSPAQAGGWQAFGAIEQMIQAILACQITGAHPPFLVPATPWTTLYQQLGQVNSLSFWQHWYSQWSNAWIYAHAHPEWAGARGIRRDLWEMLRSRVAGSPTMPVPS